jgi:hypothetical protein
VRDRKSRVAACGGWRDWACATRFVLRRRHKAQGIAVGRLKSETPCASALFRGSWKRRRLCRSAAGCARQDGRAGAVEDCTCGTCTNPPRSVRLSIALQRPGLRESGS